MERSPASSLRVAGASAGARAPVAGVASVGETSLAPETLERAGRGEESAWRMIVEMYGRRIFALAKSRVGDPERAEEITQSVFVTLAEKLRHSGQGGSSAGEGSNWDGEGGVTGASGYSERGKFEPWLFRVAMNRIRDFGRRQTREAGRASSLELRRDEPVATASAAEREAGEFEALRAAIAQLPEADREVVELRHHADLSFKQMSQLLDEPIGTLLARHHRALRKLRAILEEAMGPSQGEGANHA